jgi:hypothetical protein
VRRSAPRPLSEYSSRVEKPPPVAIRQKASLSQSGISERLSYANTQPLFAAIARSRPLRGSERSGAAFGSINSRRTRSLVDFAEPCSPCSGSTGNGPRGRRAATHQAAHSGQSSSATFTNSRRSSRRPPCSGIGSGRIPQGRRNRTGGSALTRQPPQVISIACQHSSPRSR